MAPVTARAIKSNKIVYFRQHGPYRVKRQNTDYRGTDRKRTNTYAQ